LSPSSRKGLLGPEDAERLRGAYRSYDMVGDIIIVKIPGPLRPRRAEIGRALLRRNPRARLVLQVVGRTRAEDRTRRLEPIAGGGPTLTRHKEFGVTYVVDVSKVFFSPRLLHERYRVA